MFSEFETYLRSHATLTDDELQEILSHAEARTLRRNDFILYEGDTCRHKTFVVKGLLRTFGTHSDGSEHILQFAPENSWTLEPESYDNQTPSRCNIAAIEESRILSWSKLNFDRLLLEIPALKSFADKLISRTGHNIRQRLLSALSATPEEKYNAFVRDSPMLLQRIPLRMIAAYLGISVKTLTRLRHAQLQEEKNMVK